jgi:hypothetical protein
MNYSKSCLIFLFAALLVTGCRKITASKTTAGVAFTFGTSGQNCTGTTLAGAYITNTALVAKNTATIQVNVTSIGDYSISTDTINGIYFSNTGTFTTLGTQDVVLSGQGNPIAPGSNDYHITAGTNHCTINITTQPPGSLTCNFNGVAKDFSYAFHSSLLYNAGINFKVGGALTTDTHTNFQIWIQHPSIKPLTAGTFDVNLGNNFYVLGQYTDAVYNYWIDQSQGPTHINPFTVVITSATPELVTGTFSGIIEENAGYGPNYITVTNGVFTAPIDNY